MNRSRAEHDVYRIVRSGLWRDPEFRSLSRLVPSGQGLLLYLLTGHDGRSVPGLYVVWRDAMAAALGWSAENVQRHLDELVASGWVTRDDEVGLLWIPSAFACNLPTSTSAALSWGRMARRLPESHVLCNAAQRIEELLEEGRSSAFLEAWRRGYRNSRVANTPVNPAVNSDEKTTGARA